MGEWFEVYNATGGEVNLNGLSVTGLEGEQFSVSEDLVLTADGYAVFGSNGDTATNGGVAVHFAYSGDDFNLGNNSDDSIILSNAGGVIDEVTYTDADYPDTKGQSLSLSPDALTAAGNDDGANWCSSTTAYECGDLGTPGAANDVCQ